MDSTSYHFLHRITNLIFKSKAGMAYDKSIINIDINFDNEYQAIPKLPKPILPRKDRKDKIATIQPSAEARKTSAEIERRVQELQKFRRESQSAVEAPLLVTALVKKTNQRLDSIEVSGFFGLTFVQEDWSKYSTLMQAFDLTRADCIGSELSALSSGNALYNLLYSKVI